MVHGGRASGEVCDECGGGLWCAMRQPEGGPVMLMKGAYGAWREGIGRRSMMREGGSMMLMKGVYGAWREGI